MENEAPIQEPVWKYRGYNLKPSDFSSAMVHLFRAYVGRADVWRERLDSTTNWAVVTTGAAISITFSEVSANPLVISLCTILVTLFLWIEARRYRYYELWSLRVRLLETDFYAAMLVPPFHPDPNWAEKLAKSLLTPTFPITLREAVGRRYRYNYGWLFLVLALAWIAHVWIHPYPSSDWDVLMSRAAVGHVPGEIVLAVGVLYNSALLALGLFTRNLSQARGEILEEKGLLDFLENRSPAPSTSSDGRRSEFLSLVITREGEKLGRRILEEVNRGLTSIPATGMYTQKDCTVLTCALTDTELDRLHRVVKEIDSSALVITLPVQDIRGTGFQPLQ